MAGDTIYRDGLMAGVAIQSDGNFWKAIGYTEMGIHGKRYDKHRRELMANDTIYND